MSAQKLATSNINFRANVARQKAVMFNRRAASAAWRRKAIDRGEVASIFKPESKRLADDVRAMIEAAIAAGRVTKVPRGVSGIDCGA